MFVPSTSVTPNLSTGVGLRMTKICYFLIFYFSTRVNILDYTFSIEYKRLSKIRFLRNIRILTEIDNGHFPFH